MNKAIYKATQDELAVCNTLASRENQCSRAKRLQAIPRGLENKIQASYYLVSSPMGAPAAIAAVVAGKGKSDVIDG